MANSQEPLVTKQELCELLKMRSVKSIEYLMRKKRIPFNRVSPRQVRFNVAKVMVALDKFETKQAGDR